MATLDPPFGGLLFGSHDLYASLLGWRRVGVCAVTVNDPFRFEATGSYAVLGHNGTFDISLVLTDKNPAATSGPCTVTTAGKTISGHYSRIGSEISFSDEDHSVTASPEGRNVILQISGYPKFRILA